MAPSNFVQICKWELGASNTAPSSESALAEAGETVFYPDNRTPVEPKDYEEGGKYHAIVKLHMRFKGQGEDDKRMAAGSGWLIADDLLVTAAHCVYDHANNLGMATQIRAYVGYHGKKYVTEKDTEVQLRHGEVIVTPSSWVNGKARINDFAFVKLSKPFTGVKPMPFLPTPSSGNEKLGVVGYPADKQQDDEHGALMYCCSETVAIDRSTEGLLSYKISTYPGQSGSPVLLFGKDEYGNETISGSIATHVAGSFGSNYGSPIASDDANPYGLVKSFFFGGTATPPASCCRGDISYYNVPLKYSESDITPAVTAWFTSKEINKNIPDDILSNGPLLQGPIGPSSSILAGAMVGYLGQLTQSMVDSNGCLPSSLPRPTGCAERAILADSALQYILNNGTIPKANRLTPEERKPIYANIKLRYNEAYPSFMDAAPRIAGIVYDCAPRLALSHIRRSDAGTLPDGSTSDEKYDLSPTDESDLLDAKTTLFRDRLMDPTAKLINEESFFDILGDVINLGLNLTVPNTILKLAPVALGLLSDVVRSESAVFSDGDSANNEATPAERDHEAQEKARAAELAGIVSRAVLAEAALSSLIDADKTTLLDEKGFFDYVKTVMQSVGGAVIQNAPRVLDAALPLLKELLKPEQALPSDGGSGGEGSDEESNDGDFDNAGDDPEPCAVKENQAPKGQVGTGSGKSTLGRLYSRMGPPPSLTEREPSRTLLERYLAARTRLVRPGMASNEPDTDENSNDAAFADDGITTEELPFEVVDDAWLS